MEDSVNNGGMHVLEPFSNHPDLVFSHRKCADTLNKLKQVM